MNVIAYPSFIAQIGGARLVRHNGKSAWVELIGQTIRLPFRELAHSLDDGCKVAEIAKTYAYRNH